ncbi:MAG TPA: galactokinase [Planctomycetota bacterium]|nr:galactokinase [Planctomycetota bacterium]
MPREPTRELLARHARAFEAAFGAGTPPRTWFSPGRVNLMGAHLDYNGGPVMPTAIDRGTFFAVRPRSDRRVRLASTLEARGRELDLDGPPFDRRGEWADYPAGVIEGLRRSAPRAKGLDILFGGNLPVGAGLSSSASICVGTACVLDVLWELGSSPLERVHAALRAEREFVGVRCGIMDPYAVGMARAGNLLWLDCKDASIEHLPLDPARLSIAVADTGVRRELAQGSFNERVAEAQAALRSLQRFAPDATCLRDITVELLDANRTSLGPVERRRAEHVVHEVARTFAARGALERGDLPAFGAQMFAAHASLRDLYEVSCVELDVLVDAARDASGVFGARLTGAGFGGCVVMLIDSRHTATTVEHVAQRFAARFGRRPPIEIFGGDPGPREIRA